MLLSMLLASNAANTIMIGVTLPKRHVALHFSCLDLTNEMVLLMMMSANMSAKQGIHK